MPLVTGIRHWSTPDYTRVAIDLEQEVKYEAGRVSDPDRIFFDLHDTKLASTLVGKTFEVSDGFLRRVRIAQFQKGMVRVVLEVDDVSDYSAFLLPNPYRLIIDIHGRKPNAPQTLVAQAKLNEEKRFPAPSLPQEAKSDKSAPEQSSPVSSQGLPNSGCDRASSRFRRNRWQVRRDWAENGRRQFRLAAGSAGAETSCHRPLQRATLRHRNHCSGECRLKSRRARHLPLSDHFAGIDQIRSC